MLSRSSSSIPSMALLLLCTKTFAFQPLAAVGHRQFRHHHNSQSVINHLERYSSSCSELVFDDDIVISSGAPANQDDKPPSIWSQLERITEPFQEANDRVMFNVKELETYDTDLALKLQEEAGIQFDVPKTWNDAISTFLENNTIKFILSVLSATILFRLSLPEAPLGLADVATIITTRALWEAQEWAVHSVWFHGNEHGKAHSPFETHDNHHMLPYNHVAIEPLRMCVIWFAIVSLIATAGVNMLHIPAAVASVSLATYVFCGLTYISMHYMCHTKVPLGKGSWMQEARQNHIKHHLVPGENLNMGPNNIDRIMKTHSYDSRFAKMNKE